MSLEARQISPQISPSLPIVRRSSSAPAAMGCAAHHFPGGLVREFAFRRAEPRQIPGELLFSQPGDSVRASLSALACGAGLKVGRTNSDNLS